MLAEASSVKSSTHTEDLENLISELVHGKGGIAVLKRLTIICKDNATIDPSSPSISSSSHTSSPSPSKPLDLPSTLHLSIWEKNKTFDRLFDAILKYLNPSRVCLFMHM